MVLTFLTNLHLLFFGIWKDFFVFLLLYHLFFCHLTDLDHFFFLSLFQIFQLFLSFDYLDQNTH